MKKIIVLLICMLSTSYFVWASGDKPIKIGQLPSAAQQFLAQHFSKAKVSYAMLDKNVLGNEYKVVFTNGNKIEFDKNGNWTDLECKTGGVPTAAVPPTILSYITQNHPKKKITEIEKESKGYEVKLHDGMDIKFDAKGNFIKYKE